MGRTKTRSFFVILANMTDLATNPPPELLRNVMNAVYTERNRLAACRRFAFASTVCAFSSVLLVPMWNALRQELAASGFGSFASLIIFDTRLVLAYWQDYGLSLLESFPALQGAAFLSLIAAFLLSAKFIAKYARSLRRLRPLGRHAQ